MALTCECHSFDDYLLELEVVDFSHPLIKNQVNELFTDSLNEIELIKIAFEYVRDSIAHSFDLPSSYIVTCKASDVLEFGQGICYAKANLLASLLRSQGIPTGFCYQWLTKGDTPDTGYCIHALNAVYVKTIQRWIRLDARGNKPGVNAQFSIGEEQLAFPIREIYEEKDYPIIYAKPNVHTINALRENTDCNSLLNNLPAQL